MWNGLDSSMEQLGHTTVACVGDGAVITVWHSPHFIVEFFPILQLQ